MIVLNSGAKNGNELLHIYLKPVTTLAVITNHLECTIIQFSEILQIYHPVPNSIVTGVLPFIQSSKS